MGWYTCWVQRARLRNTHEIDRHTKRSNKASTATQNVLELPSTAMLAPCAVASAELLALIAPARSKLKVQGFFKPQGLQLRAQGFASNAQKGHNWQGVELGGTGETKTFSEVPAKRASPVLPHYLHRVPRRPPHRLQDLPGLDKFGLPHPTSIDLEPPAQSRCIKHGTGWTSADEVPLPCASHAPAPSQAARTTASPTEPIHLSPTTLATCPFGKCCLHCATRPQQQSRDKARGEYHRPRFCQDPTLAYNSSSSSSILQRGDASPTPNINVR